jgi:hypothetical protein
MYHQINPTETFRERHLALLREADNRRLARQLGMGREPKVRCARVAAAVLSFLAALLLASLMLAASGSPTHADTTSSQSAVNNKNGGEVSIQGTTVKASFASGSGADFLGVKVSDHGNLLSFESPQSKEAAFTGREGYAICSGAGALVHGHDTGAVEEGFGAPKFKQPNPGKFPLTVTRKTTDGKLQLKQVWSKPDATEKDVTFTMTVKNISSSTILSMLLSRSGDFDVGDASADQGGRTGDSAWLWDDPSSATVETSPGGTMLTGQAMLGAEHAALIEQSSAWAGGTREVCVPAGLATPTSAQDLAMRVVYNLGSLSPGQSKTVKLEYGRM